MRDLLSPQPSQSPLDVNYDTIVRAMDGLPPHVIVKQLAVTFPDDFVEAAKNTDTVDRIILREMMRYNIGLLGNPRFDPLGIIFEHLDEVEPSRDFDRIFQRDLNMGRVLRDLIVHCELLSQDAGKALWAGLSFAQDPHVPEYVVLMNQWLNPGFLKACRWDAEPPHHGTPR